MTWFIHETSRKQINVPKVLEFSWLREETRIQGFNKDSTEPVARFHAGSLTLIPRLLAHIIAWQLTPRRSNHVVLHEEDLILLYCIMN